MNFSIYLDVALNAVSAIVVLALVALGLAIIFGFMGVINLAHGAFLTLGAYVAWLFTTEWGFSFWIGLVAAPLIVGFVGFIVEFIVVRRLYHRLLDTILATWGVSLIIQEVIRFLAGSGNKPVATPIPGSVPVGPTLYPAYRLFLIALGVAVISVVFLVFNRTNFGIRLRAVIQDETSAALLGLNRQRIYSFTFSLGAGLAGIAGAAITPITAVRPTMGVSYLVQSFFAVILGGMGTLVGIIPGSAVVAGATNIMTFFIQPVTAETIIFVIVIALIVIRPSGFLGRQL